MSVKVRMEFNSAGFKEVLESDGVRAAVDEIGQEIASRANANISGESDGFEVTTVKGYDSDRWITIVTASDFEASKEEAENKVLTRAVK